MINKALQAAIRLHNGQKRKLGNYDYVIHPIEVGISLAKQNEKDEVIVAAILHDTIEDTEYTYEKICSDFGKSIADMVLGCSELNKKLSWKERKLHTINHLKDETSMEVKKIICADKLNNLKSVLKFSNDEDKKEIWHSFNAGYDDQKWYYSEIIKILKDDLDGYALYEELKVIYFLIFK